MKHTVNPATVTYMESDQLRSRNTASIQTDSRNVNFHLQKHAKQDNALRVCINICVSKYPKATGQQHHTKLTVHTCAYSYHPSTMTCQVVLRLPKQWLTLQSAD